MQTFTPIEYLKIDIANNYGLDKLSWDERIKWFNEVESNLDAEVANAEEQALFYAGVQAYKKATQGLPIGYPISLDATASGTQWLALLSGCKKTAALCNVIDVGRRVDAYTDIYRAMDVGNDISRNDVKKAIMTHFYNSRATPKRIFPNQALLDHFYATINAVAPGANSLNNIIQQLQDPTATKYEWTLPDGFEVVTKVMGLTTVEARVFDDYFEVTYKENKPTDFDLSLSANYIHSIDAYAMREVIRRCNYDPETVSKVQKLLFLGAEAPEEYEDTHNLEMVAKLWNLYCDTNILSVRILDYLDEETITLVDPLHVLYLLSMLPEKPFEVLGVHDCFRVLPSYGNDLRKQYNIIMWEIADSNVLNFNLSQIARKDITVNPADKYTKEEILNANYALS